MSNIFNFRPRKKGPPNSDFLKDADDTVEFDHTGRDVSFGNTPEHYLNASRNVQLLLRDWDNQELANIYRVKKLLDAAGVPNDLERGISDEGDPWCIFCTLNGDVFIHLCRVDGRYILDSPNLRSPIAGVDFTDMIAEFSAGALRSTPAAEKNAGRVIKLERNGKVFLHPATLLAALIWSVYLNSEDLVMFAPEENLAGGDGFDGLDLLQETAMAPLSDAEAAEAAQFIDTPALPDHIVGTRLAGDAEVRETTMFKDIAQKSAMILTPTPIAVGLSSIAIAFGLVSESYFDPEPEVELAGLDATVADTGAKTAPVDHGDDRDQHTAPFDLVTALQSVFDHPAEPLEAEQSALYAELVADIDLSTILSSMIEAPVQTDVAVDLTSGFQFQDSWVDDGPLPAIASTEEREKKQIDTTEKEKTEEVKQKAVEQQESLPENVDVVVATTNITNSDSTIDTEINFASLLDFQTTFVSTFESFDFASLTVEEELEITSISSVTTDTLVGSTASEEEPTVIDTLEDTVEDTVFDPATIDLADFDPVPTPPTPQQPVAPEQPFTPEPMFNAIDLNAQAFIQFLGSESKKLEIRFLENEIILVDLEIIEAQSADTYSMSWSLADGATVSTVGLKSDFMEFDLIA